jgi:hypothetical protein
MKQYARCGQLKGAIQNQQANKQLLNINIVEGVGTSERTFHASQYATNLVCDVIQMRDVRCVHKFVLRNAPQAGQLERCKESARARAPRRNPPPLSSV